MDLILINSPIQEYSKEYKPNYRTTAPIGLGYLATVAFNAGIETKIIDAEAKKLTINEIVNEVNGLSPRIVGINMSSTNYNLSLDIIKKINAPLKLLGGPHATLRGDKIKGNYTIVRGEAEKILVDILKNKKKGVINAGTIENLDDLPFINRSFFSNDPYKIDGKLESAISTTRGCIYNCIFCSVPSIQGQKVRSRSVENIISEIDKLKNKGINSFHFIDDLFNYNRRKVIDFCDYLIKNKMNITWRDLCRIELLDNFLLEKMRESGCYQLAFGLESGSSRVLKYIGKSSDFKRTQEILNKCGELGIKTKAFFTIGYPNENADEIKRTIDFSLSLNLNEAYFMVVRAFPGTRLYDELLKKGFSEKKLDNYYQFKDNNKYVKYHVMNSCSLNGLSNKKLDNYIKEAYSLFYKEKTIAEAYR